MGLLYQGKWRTDLTQVDKPDQFATNILAEKERYHFYYSLGCPFAHRANLVIHYLGLNEAISSGNTAPIMGQNGLMFDEKYQDRLFHFNYLHQVYTSAKSDFSGRVSVPVLWDKQAKTIASHNSAELSFHLATQWQSLA